MALDPLSKAMRLLENRGASFGESAYLSEWDRFWRDLSGKTARAGLFHVAGRIAKLERGDRVTIETLMRLATEAANERARPFEEMHATLHAAHEETLARVANLTAQVEDQRSAVEALRDRLSEHVENLERSLAQLPEALRADLRIELDNLRNSPEAVTALLFGAETFAGAVARSLEDAR